MELSTTITTDLELILPEGIEFVRSTAGVECFTGYAARFYNPAEPGTEYQVNPAMKERIDRRAFDETPFDDVELWFEHNNSYVMGEVRTKTLFLSVDNKGLRFDAPFDPDDPDHVKALAKIRKKRINGASIGFRGQYDVKKEGNTWIRTITKVDALREFSLVNKPAYTACAISFRSQELAKLEEEAKRKAERELRLKKFLNF